MRLRKVMLFVLVLLTLNLNGCAEKLVILREREKVWLVPQDTIVQTTEGSLKTDAEMVLMDKGYMLEKIFQANDEALKPKPSR